jgi:hypothetical protein
VKPYIKSDEDKLTYALFPQTALEFFKKREEKHEETKPGVPPEKLAELEEVAALSAAAVNYVQSLSGVKALTLRNNKGTCSYWVLAARQNQTDNGA